MSKSTINLKNCRFPCVMPLSCHLCRMCFTKICHKIRNFITFWKCITARVNVVKQDLVGASEMMVQERNKFTTWIRDVKYLLEKTRRRMGAKLEERKVNFSA